MYKQIDLHIRYTCNEKERQKHAQLETHTEKESYITNATPLMDRTYKKERDHMHCICVFLIGRLLSEKKKLVLESKNKNEKVILEISYLGMSKAKG